MAVLAATAGAVLAYGDPRQIAKASTLASSIVSDMLRKPPQRMVQVARGQAGEFALRAAVNGVSVPMVVDTGATSVVLTFETAKAAGLPLELLDYDVEVETAGGHTRAARSDAGSAGDRQTGRTLGAGAGGAARPDEDESARHELSRPAGELGSARRQADAARLSLRSVRAVGIADAFNILCRRPRVTRRSRGRIARTRHLEKRHAVAPVDVGRPRRRFVARRRIRGGTSGCRRALHLPGMLFLSSRQRLSERAVQGPRRCLAARLSRDLLGQARLEGPVLS